MIPRMDTMKTENLVNRENPIDGMKSTKTSIFPKPRPALRDLSSNIGNSTLQHKPVNLKKDESKAPKSNKTKITEPKERAPVKREESILNVLSFSGKQLNIYNPDVNTRNDPNAVTEYLPDIFSYLMKFERQLSIRKNFLHDHKTTPAVRAILINWIVEVQLSFKLCIETLHLCVSIIDRYLQENNQVGRETLQLVGITALWIASKYEEVLMPDITDFIYVCDNAFTERQMTSMEKNILGDLKFYLGRPTSIHFLRRYSKIAQVNALQHNLSKYLLELALLDYGMCHILPSHQAAAACCLSIAVLNEEMDLTKVWSPTLIHYTTYKLHDFRPVIVLYALLLKKIENSKYKAVTEKYASASFGKISTNSKLKGRLIMKLTAEKTSKTTSG